MIRYGCKIGPNVIIGNNVFIESGVKIRDAIIYDKTFIGQNVKIENAIIGDNCRVAENVEIKGKKEGLVILASTVEVLKGIKLITPDDRNISFCHHEVVRDSIE